MMTAFGMTHKITPVLFTGVDHARVIQFNDFENNMDSLPYLVSSVNRAVMETPDTFDPLVFPNGDNNLGANPDLLQVTLDAFKHIPHMVGVLLGNHEFDMLPSWVLPRLASLNLPMLCVNMELKPGKFKDTLEESGITIEPSVVVDKDHGKYGVIGVSMPQLFEKIRPHPTEFEGFSIVDLEESIQRVKDEARKLRAQGIETIFVSTHWSLFQDQALARACQPGEISAILGGHVHKTLTDLVEGETYIHGIPIIHAGPIKMHGTGGDQITVSDMVFNDGVFSPEESSIEVVMTRQDPANPFAQGLVDDFKATMEEPIGVLPKEYPKLPPWAPNPELGEGIAYWTRQLSGSNVGTCRYTEIRNPVKSGVFRKFNLSTASSPLPFMNEIVELSITGQQLIDVLELNEAHKANQSIHTFYLSGIQYGYNDKSGEVEWLGLEGPNGEPVDVVERNQFETILQKPFTMAVSWYTAFNTKANLFPMLKAANALSWQIIHDKKDPITYWDVLAQWVRSMSQSSAVMLPVGNTLYPKCSSI